MWNFLALSLLVVLHTRYVYISRCVPLTEERSQTGERGHTGPEGRGQTVPEGKGETVPEGRGQTLPEGW